MKKQKALRILKANAKKLKQDFHVSSLYLFGSTARDEASAKSDVDVLVDFSSSKVDLFQFLRLKEFLESILDAKVDLVTRDALKEWMLANLEREAIRAA